MRIQREKIEIEATEAIASQAFSIREQDMSFVIDVLRKKMYQNPIFAFVREIACNARDAHREVNQPNKPIEITLPTQFSKQIEIADKGPSINPRRMSLVFLNYGASTKRETNKQQGSFGLGAKSIFGVTNSFSVNTVHCGIKRFYTAIIDETNVGRMDLIREIPTDEETGTTIIVPAKECDFQALAKAVIDSTTHWSEKHNSGVRPIIHNLPASIAYPADKKIMLEGEDWELYHPKTNNYYYERLTIIIDGIAYAVSDADLDLSYQNSNHNHLRSLLTKNINVYFGIGKLSLASNRDNIHFDDKTKKVIIEKLKSIIDQIITMGSEQAIKEPSLDKAEIFWSKFREYITFAGKTAPIWNGYELTGTSRNIGTTNVSISSYGYNNTRRSATPVFSRSSAGVLYFAEKSEIFLQDEDKPYAVGKRIQKYIDENPETKTVFVITFADVASKTYWMDTHGLKHVATKLISSLPEHVQERKTKTPAEKKEFLRAKKNEVDAWELSFVNGKPHWEHMILDASTSKGIFIETTNKKTNEFATGKVITDNDYQLRDIKDYLPENIYAIKTENISKLDSSNWFRMEDVLISRVEKELATFLESDIEKIGQLYLSSFDYMFENKIYFNITDRQRLVDLINDKNSAFINFINESIILKSIKEKSDKIRKLQHSFGYLVDSSKRISNPYLKDCTLPVLKKEVERRYQLLCQARMYHANNSAIAEYINLIDEKYNNLAKQAKVA